MRGITILMTLLTFKSFGQNGPINIHLNTNEIISTRYAYLYSSSQSYVRIDERKGQKIPINSVDHIEGFDEKGNYRFFLPVRITPQRLVWAERGFSSERIVIYHTDIVTGTMAANHKPKSCLYSKDNGPIKPLDLRDLRSDLGDCPASIEFLRKGKNIGIAQAGVRIVSYALILGGTIKFLSDASVQEPGDPSKGGPDIPAGIIVGAVTAWIPVLMANEKNERYLEALKAYK